MFMAFCAVFFLHTESLRPFPKQAEAVLETFRAHASQRISQLEQDLTSMRTFRGLLQEAQTQLVIVFSFFLR